MQSTYKHVAFNIFVIKENYVYKLINKSRKSKHTKYYNFKKIKLSLSLQKDYFVLYHGNKST